MCTPYRGIKGLSGGLPADIDEFFYKHSVMHAYTFIHTIHTCANLAVYEAECVVILLPTIYTQVMSAGFVWDGASNLPGPGARSQEPGTCEIFRTGTRRLWLKSKHQAHRHDTCSFKKKKNVNGSVATHAMSIFCLTPRDGRGTAAWFHHAMIDVPCLLSRLSRPSASTLVSIPAQTCYAQAPSLTEPYCRLVPA